MKRVISNRWMILLSALVLAAFAIAAYTYIGDGFSKLSGQTAKEASQVVPVSHKISLKGKPHDGGVLLTWKSPKGALGNYYDIYRRIPGLEGGWGEQIGRITFEKDFYGSYEFTDRNVEVGKKYIYQIILVKLSNGYEIKDQASNSIEITLK